MILRKIVFLVNDLMQYPQGSLPTTNIQGDNVNTDAIYLVSPFDVGTLFELRINVKATVGGNTFTLPMYPQTLEKGKDVTSEPYAAEWNVWRVVIPRALTKRVARYSSNTAFISFAIKDGSLANTEVFPLGINAVLEEGQIEEIDETLYEQLMQTIADIYITLDNMALGNNTRDESIEELQGIVRDVLLPALGSIPAMQDDIEAIKEDIAQIGANFENIQNYITVGANGNWFVNGFDTGSAARGQNIFTLATGQRVPITGVGSEFTIPRSYISEPLVKVGDSIIGWDSQSFLCAARIYAVDSTNIYADMTNKVDNKGDEGVPGQEGKAGPAFLAPEYTTISSAAPSGVPATNPAYWVESTSGAAKIYYYDHVNGAWVVVTGSDGITILPESLYTIEGDYDTFLSETSIKDVTAAFNASTQFKAFVAESKARADSTDNTFKPNLIFVFNATSTNYIYAENVTFNFQTSSTIVIFYLTIDNLQNEKIQYMFRITLNAAGDTVSLANSYPYQIPDIVIDTEISTATIIRSGDATESARIGNRIFQIATIAINEPHMQNCLLPTCTTTFNTGTIIKKVIAYINGVNGSLVYYNFVSDNTNYFIGIDTNGQVSLTKEVYPTVYDSQVVITQGGAIKGSFTLNQSFSQLIELDGGGGSGGGTAFSFDLNRAGITNPLAWVDTTSTVFVSNETPTGAEFLTQFYVYLNMLVSSSASNIDAFFFFEDENSINQNIEILSANYYQSLSALNTYHISLNIRYVNTTNTVRNITHRFIYDNSVPLTSSWEKVALDNTGLDIDAVSADASRPTTVSYENISASTITKAHIIKAYNAFKLGDNPFVWIGYTYNSGGTSSTIHRKVYFNFRRFISGNVYRYNINLKDALIGVPRTAGAGANIVGNRDNIGFYTYFGSQSTLDSTFTEAELDSGVTTGSYYVGSFPYTDRILAAVSGASTFASSGTRVYPAFTQNMTNGRLVVPLNDITTGSLVRFVSTSSPYFYYQYYYDRPNQSLFSLPDIMLNSFYYSTTQTQTEDTTRQYALRSALENRTYALNIGQTPVGVWYPYDEPQVYNSAVAGATVFVANENNEWAVWKLGNYVTNNSTGDYGSQNSQNWTKIYEFESSGGGTPTHPEFHMPLDTPGATLLQWITTPNRTWTEAVDFNAALNAPPTSPPDPNVQPFKDWIQYNFDIIINGMNDPNSGNILEKLNKNFYIGTGDSDNTNMDYKVSNLLFLQENLLDFSIYYEYQILRYGTMPNREIVIVKHFFKLALDFNTGGIDWANSKLYVINISPWGLISGGTA